MNEQEMKARFETLAPWHVNGTLEPSERRWVDDYVRDHPEAVAELRWYESLQSNIRANVPETDPDLGWDKLQQRIRLDQRKATDSWAKRLGVFLLRPAFAYAAIALVVIQAGVIGTLVLEQSRQQADFEQWRSLPGGGITSIRETPPGTPSATNAAQDKLRRPVLRVSFKAETPERDIRTLLRVIGGTIVGGPSQMGDYMVYVPANRIKVAADLLKADEHVDTVDILPRLPDKE